MVPANPAALRPSPTATPLRPLATKPHWSPPVHSTALRQLQRLPAPQRTAGGGAQCVAGQLPALQPGTEVRRGRRRRLHRARVEVPGLLETDDYDHDTNNQTGRDLLLRLVEYQDVYYTLVTENEQQQLRFPDNIVELVRSARDRATEEEP
ncbi:hypothetical protein PG994_003342 [Apiospora phragmitis]|uniref:DUF5753 domain-containing protein n=1 Tax=Apiospora phragmitis TaxID=2905665 RepID=A0ABR1W0Z7_9PEZI